MTTIKQRMLLATLIIFNYTVRPLHSQIIKQPDVTTIAATALGLIGLGSLGWYLKKSKAAQSLQAEKAQQERQQQELRTNKSLLYVLTAQKKSTEQQFEELKELLKNPGIRLNDRDSFGSLPLINAVANNNEAMVTFLLDHGAQINMTDEKEETALMKTVETGNKKIAQLLLDRGAFVNQKNLLKQTPLSRAYEKGQKELIEIFDKQMEKHRARLFTAAREGDIDTIRSLLAELSIDTTNNRGETILFSAVRHNHPKLVTFLIQHGAAVSWLNNRKQSLLFPAIDVSTHEKVIGSLLGYLLIQSPKSRELQQMINMQDADGNTPLMYAAGTRKDVAVAILLDLAGAKTDIINSSGYSVFDIAETQQQRPEEREILRILKAHAQPLPKYVDLPSGRLYLKNIQEANMFYEKNKVSK